MAILGSIIRNALQLRKRFQITNQLTPYQKQHKQLTKLLKKAEDTDFGWEYDFTRILFAKKNMEREFRNNIPIFTYNDIAAKWWNRSINGEANVSWPGKVKYFALSSGTSESGSKRIPITKEMLTSIKKTSIRQIIELTQFNLPDETFWKGALLLGGSTRLSFKHQYYEGDLSGISAKHRPLWFQRYYKPGGKIASQKNWDKKINQIIEQAPNWDIGFIVGIPAWIQILLEKIIERYQLKTIHDIWPNLNLYIHSGVAFEPYEKSFDKLFGKKVARMESYLASEGFFAFQTRPNQQAMNMVLTNGIFYEFVPFDEQHFDENGDLLQGATTKLFDEVEVDKEYALVISTCAGTWRYLIGDVIRFKTVETAEIVITGRTKHFLSITGEHLSVENMSKAIGMAANDLNVVFNEYTVTGETYDTLFAHRWYIGCDDLSIDANLVSEKLDAFLCSINDDYATERESALKKIFVELIPTSAFNAWLLEGGKVGAQVKFPRVLKGEKLLSWKKFLETYPGKSN
jgi:hypothetical protein